jgi:prophage DNA circulation protein
MDLALLGRLRQAKYKDVSVLIENSSIRFGQKTVTHQYPDSNRTEVEFLGLAEDQFQIDLYIKGPSLLEKRKRLKQKLEEPSLGKLVHPYQGEILCAAINCEVKEVDKRFGISGFTVTFQQASNPSYPDTSENTKPLILRGIDTVLGVIEDGFDSLTAVFSDNAILTATKLNDIFDTFDNAASLTYKVADKANELNEGILDFQDKIASYAVAPATLGLALKNLFSTFNFASSDNKSQLEIWKSMFSFGSWDDTINEDTMAHIERKKTFKAINDCINVNALAMAYGTISQIEFSNDDELAVSRAAIEDQYEDIKQDLDNDVIAELDTLRTNTLAYLDSLDLADVTTTTVQPTCILLLAYDNYGDIDKYDDLFYLNEPYDPGFIKGSVKILSE